MIKHRRQTSGADGWETICSCQTWESNMLISNVRNSLLAQFSASDLAALSGHLEPIELPKNFELASFNEKISHYLLLY
jgi:hypothetical protein